MKKTFKSVMYVCAVALTMGTMVLTTGCKNKKEDTTKEVSNENKSEGKEFTGLKAILAKACEGYSCSSYYDDDCDDDDACSGSSCGDDEDDFELIDVDTVQDDEGNEIPVAYFKCGGEIFQLMDIDCDGTFDVAVCDGNGDDDITEDEILDISDEEITLDDIAEAAGMECGDDDDDSCGGGSCYNDDDDDDSYSSGGSGRRLQREAREDAAERDLPDYVNNANVKALRKK